MSEFMHYKCLNSFNNYVVSTVIVNGKYLFNYVSKLNCSIQEYSKFTILSQLTAQYRDWIYEFSIQI